MKRIKLRSFACVTIVIALFALIPLRAVLAAEVLFNYQYYKDSKDYITYVATSHDYYKYMRWTKAEDEGVGVHYAYYTAGKEDLDYPSGYKASIKQNVTLTFSLPDEYTSFFSKNRTYRHRYYKVINNSDTDNQFETYNEQYKIWYEYEDYDYYAGKPISLGQTFASVKGNVSLDAPMITLYSECVRRGNQTTIEEVIEKRKDEIRRMDGDHDNFNEASSFNVTEVNGNTLFIYYDNAHHDNEGKTYNKTWWEDGNEYVLETTEVVADYNYTTDYYYYYKIPELPDVFIEYRIRLHYAIEYVLGQKNPRAEAQELYAEYLSWVDRAKSLVNVLFEMRPTIEYGEPEYFDDEVPEVNISVVTDAAKDKGETGVNIPLEVFGGVAGIAAALGAAGVAGNAGKKRKKKQSTFTLAINKDFGDTIMMNSAPVSVFARIIEHTPEGQSVPRPDLSEHITISAASEGINVEPSGMSGGYQSAKLTAPFSQQTECMVAFRFSYEMNSFTNNVIFKLAEPKIIFTQENIALPACYEEVEPLEFKVEGIDSEKTQIFAEMSGNSSYQVDIATDPEQAKNGLFMAMIKDINKKAGTPGTYSEETLNITATDGTTTAYGSLPIYRVTEGLYIALDAVNCYGELRPDAQRNEDGIYPPGSYQSACTEAKAWLMTLDMENNAVVQSSVSPEVEFCSNKPEDCVEIEGEDWSEDKQEHVDVEKLGIVMFVDAREAGYSNCRFYCSNGLLQSPTRIVAYMKAQVTVGEGENTRTFKLAKQVLLRSQPRRLSQSEAEADTFYKQDKEITHRLESMLEYIEMNALCDALMPLYEEGCLQLRGWDPEYGFDIEKTTQILDTFRLWYDQNVTAYLERAQKIANLYAANYSYTDAVMDTFRERSHTVPGIAARIIIGIASGGNSEYFVFLPMDVAASVHEYNKTRLPEESTTLGQIWAGSKPVLWAAAFSMLPGAAKSVFRGGKKACGAVITGLGKIVKPAGKYIYKAMPTSVKALSSKMGQYMATGIEKVKQYDPRKYFKNWNSSADSTNTALRNGESAATNDLAKLRGMAKTLDQRLANLADEFGSLNGWKTVKTLADEAKQLGKNGKTIESLKKQVLDIMNDPQAVEQLNKMSGQAGKDLRKIFNEVQEKYIYKPARDKTIQMVVSKLGKNPAKLRFRNVTSNTDEALFSGDKIRHDLDVTVEEFVNGKWVPLKQNQVKPLYHQAFCEASGLKFGSPAEAIKVSESYQQHVCQSMEDAEFLPEVEKIIFKENAGKAVSGSMIDRVKYSLGYKQKVLYNEGTRLCGNLSEAEKLAVEKEVMTAMTKHGETGQLIDLSKLSQNARNYVRGYALKKEGVRGSEKVFEQLTWKNTKSMSYGAKDAISAESYKTAGYVKNLSSHGENHISMGDFEAGLELNNTSYIKHTENLVQSYDMANSGVTLGFGATK